MCWSFYTRIYIQYTSHSPFFSAPVYIYSYFFPLISRVSSLNAVSNCGRISIHSYKSRYIIIQLKCRVRSMFAVQRGTHGTIGPSGAARFDLLQFSAVAVTHELVVEQTSTHCYKLYIITSLVFTL